MKIKLFFKDPDILNRVLDANHREFVAQAELDPRLVKDEFYEGDLEEIVNDLRAKAKKAIEKFVAFGEYLDIEVDTETAQARVISCEESYHGRQPSVAGR